MSTIKPSELNTYVGVQEFLRGDKAIQQVLSTPHLKPKEGQLQGKWTVCQWVTSPFKAIYAVFFRALSRALFFMGCDRGALTMRRVSFFFSQGNGDLSLGAGRVLKLKGCKNRPNASGEILNNHPPIPVSDPRLIKRLVTKESRLEFNHRDGVCRGIIEWFLYLYLKTQDQFSDPRTHLTALGKLFKNGAPKESVLLQSLSKGNGKILGVYSRARDASICFIKDLLVSPKAENLCMIEDLPIGAYLIAYCHKENGHAMGYIKISDQLGYLVEPCTKLKEVKGANQLSELLHMLLEVHMRMPKTQDENEIIGFIPFSLRS